jgi:Flp pilus assembly pilin Flp
MDGKALVKLRTATAAIGRLAGCGRAASAVEYSLLAALIAVAVVAVLIGVGSSVGTTYDNAAAAIHRNAVATYTQ